MQKLSLKNLDTSKTTFTLKYKGNYNGTDHIQINKTITQKVQNIHSFLKNSTEFTTII